MISNVKKEFKNAQDVVEYLEQIEKRGERFKILNSKDLPEGRAEVSLRVFSAEPIEEDEDDNHDE